MDDIVEQFESGRTSSKSEIEIHLMNEARLERLKLRQLEKEEQDES